MSYTFSNDSIRGYSAAFGRRGVMLKANLVAQQIILVDISPIKSVQKVDTQGTKATTGNPTFVPESAPSLLLMDFGAPVTDTVYIEVTGI